MNRTDAIRWVHDLVTDPGEVSVVTLPDGAGRWLTDRSVMVHLTALGAERVVDADGIYRLHRFQTPQLLQTAAMVADLLHDLPRWLGRQAHDRWLVVTPTCWGLISRQRWSRLLERTTGGASAPVWVDAGVWSAWSGLVSARDGVVEQARGSAHGPLRISVPGTNGPIVLGYLMPQRVTTRPTLPRSLAGRRRAA